MGFLLPPSIYSCKTYKWQPTVILVCHLPICHQVHRNWQNQWGFTKFIKFTFHRCIDVIYIARCSSARGLQLHYTASRGFVSDSWAFLYTLELFTHVVITSRILYSRNSPVVPHFSRSLFPAFYPLALTHPALLHSRFYTHNEFYHKILYNHFSVSACCRPLLKMDSLYSPKHEILLTFNLQVPLNQIVDHIIHYLLMQLN